MNLIHHAMASRLCQVAAYRLLVRVNCIGG